LGLDESASELVLPTSVGVFKMNRTVTSTAKVLFMAALTGTVVGPHALLVFVGTVVLLSFATPGLPAGGSNITTGAYLAAGIPIEAIVVFETVDGPTDAPKTAVNVLADLAVALFVSRAVTRTRTSPSPTLSTTCEERHGPRPTTF
jgi:Na+/H+-dicarboxylate symporter